MKYRADKAQMREQIPQPKRKFSARTQGYFRWSHPKGNPLGANKYSYQNIFLFFQTENNL